LGTGGSENIFEGDEHDASGDDRFDHGGRKGDPTEGGEGDGDGMGGGEDRDDSQQTPPRDGSEGEGDKKEEMIVAGEHVMQAMAEEGFEGGGAFKRRRQGIRPGRQQRHRWGIHQGGEGDEVRSAAAKDGLTEGASGGVGDLEDVIGLPGNAGGVGVSAQCGVGESNRQGLAAGWKWALKVVGHVGQVGVLR